MKLCWLWTVDINVGCCFGLSGDLKLTAPSFRANGRQRFEVAREEDTGKLKAVNVTAPGGHAVEPPPRPTKSWTVSANATEGTNPTTKGKRDGSGARRRSRQQGNTKKNIPKLDPPFHHIIKQEIKNQIQSRGLDLNLKSTVDISVGEARIKLGQGGYAGLAHAKGKVGEGSYVCSDEGLVTFCWERCLSYSSGAWTPDEPGNLISSVSLLDGKCLCC